MTKPANLTSPDLHEVSSSESATMDGGSTLKLDKNEKTVRWVLDRLQQDNTCKASTLAVYQGVPVYYAASATKQSGAMISAKRDALSASTYEELAVPGFLKLLEENYEFTTPGWLTRGLMGQTTFSGENIEYWCDI